MIVFHVDILKLMPLIFVILSFLIFGFIFLCASVMDMIVKRRKKST